MKFQSFTPIDGEQKGFAGRLLKTRSGSKRQLVLFALVFAAIGGIIIWRSFAAAPELTGTLKYVHTDDFKKHKSSLARYLVTSTGKKISLDISGASDDDLFGGQVRIKNVTQSQTSDNLKISASQIEKLSATTTPTGPQKTAVVMYRFAGDPVTPPRSAADLRSDIFTGPHSTSAFFKEESYGAISLTGLQRSDGDIFGYYLIPGPIPPDSDPACSEGPLGKLETKINNILVSKGIEITKYQHVVYTTPHELCRAGGIASHFFMPEAWANLSAEPVKNGATWRIAAHELTHNFGTAHANALICKNPSGLLVSISSNCSVKEFGDPYDVMGNSDASSSSITHSNNYFLYSIGWLSSNSVQTISSSGTYTLKPVEQSGDPRLLRILRGKIAGNSQFYNLEYRQPAPYFDKTIYLPSVFQGATIRLDHVKPGEGVVTGIISMHPGTAEPEPMHDGDTFSDGGHGIKIQQLSHSAMDVQLKITVGASSDSQPPTRVTGLRATWTVSSVTLSWDHSTDNLGVDHYEVTRAVGGIPGNLLGDIPDSQTNLAITDDHVVSGTTYDYQVYAVDKNGNYSEPAVVSARPGADPNTPPSKPGNIALTPISGSEIDLAWPTSTDDVWVAGYDIYRAPGSSSTFGKVGFVASQSGDSPPKITTKDTNGLAAGSSYCYKVVAFDSAGNRSPESNVACAATKPRPDTTPPAAPTGIAGTPVSSSQISLAWNASTDNPGGGGVSYYIVKRVGSSVSTSNTSYSEAGLAASTTYTYTISAVDVAGNISPPSTPVAVTTKANTDTSPPTAPRFPSAVGLSSSQMKLTWTASSDNVGVTYYQVWRDNGFVANTTSTSFVDGNLSPSSTHIYKIYAFDAAGNKSLPSAGFSGTTLPPSDDHNPPSAPPNLQAVGLNNSSIKVTWDASSDDVGVVGYYVFREISYYTTLPSPAPGIGTGFYDNGLPGNTSYTYCVFAFDAANNLSPQSCATGTTTH